jgi:hypothetical protein
MKIPALLERIDVKVGHIQISSPHAPRRPITRIGASAGMGRLIAAPMRQRELCIPTANRRQFG